MTAHIDGGPARSVQLPPRAQWLRCLKTADRSALTTLAASLRETYPTRHRRVPQSGLALLELREQNRGERFNAGEIPLSTAEIELQDADGARHLGAAQIMDGDRQLAEDLAICDVVLAAALPGAEQVAELLHAGGERVAELDRQRAGILARTTVAFDLLEEDTDD